jgi:tetratricopeptide (TPR) repeat protein
MNGDRTARGIAWLLGLVLLVGGTWTGGSCRKAEPERRWSWQAGGLEQLLAAARAQDAAALLEVYATWCPTCHQLEHEVFDENARRLPADRLVGGRIDFDSPAGQDLAVRYRVMGLPTTLLLDADGNEKGRILGYETVDAYLDGLSKAMAGADETATALAALAGSPDDPQANADAGAAHLARGEETEGLRLLERARELDATAKKEVYADATRTLGRYFFRIKHQYDRALAYFREGAAQAGDTEAAWGFHYWIAMSLRALGQPDIALAWLQQLVAEHPGVADPVSLEAEYLYMTGGKDADALALAQRAAQLKPTDDWSHYLVGVLAERSNDHALAVEAARRAVQLAPGKAIYEHLLERLTRPSSP